MTTAIYARVSTSKQANDRQVKSCRSQLSEEEFENHELYADIGSGAKEDREEIQRLISDIEKEKIDKIVTWEISRIGRKLSFVSKFIDLCVEHDVQLETVNDMFPGIKPGNDIFDKMINQFTAWMMEFEREMIRERVQSGVNQAIEKGKWVGRPPYGFTTNDDGYVQIKAEDYLAMQQAVERALSNTDESINKIATSFGVPQSSLDRIVKDEEKRKLYLYGETEEERLTRAVKESEVEPEAEISKLAQKMQKLEEKLEEKEDEE